MTSSRSDAAFRLRPSRSAATEEQARTFPEALHPTEVSGSKGGLVLAAVIAFYIYVHISAGDAPCGANMHACMSRRRFIHTQVSWSNSERCRTAPCQSECRADARRRCSPQTCSSSIRPRHGPMAPSHRRHQEHTHSSFVCADVYPARALLPCLHWNVRAHRK